MYTSYDRGFRAPTFVEDSKSQTLGIQVDQNTGLNYTSITEGNPNLAPEHTRNLNIGFQLSPTRTTDVGFDWYKIRVDNVIGQGSPSQTVTDPTTGNCCTRSFRTRTWATSTRTALKARSVRRCRRRRRDVHLVG